MAERKQTRRSVREQSKAAFRTAILEAAEQVFTREGFSAAKMADIAAEAGVAAGTLYNYFGSKTEIFKSIMMAGAREFSERVERAANEPDPIERLRQVCAQALEFLGDHGSLFLIYVQLHGGTEMETYASAIEHAEMRARHLQLMVSSVRDAQALRTGWPIRSSNASARCWLSLSARSSSIVLSTRSAISTRPSTIVCVTQEYRGQPVTVNYLPKVKIDLVVETTPIDDVIDAIVENAQTGNIGDGKIFIMPVTDAVRVRTKERGPAAV